MPESKDNWKRILNSSFRHTLLQAFEESVERLPHPLSQSGEEIALKCWL